MHKDLEAWLDQVWKEKDKIIGLSPAGHSGRGVHIKDNPAIWEVYGMYNDAGGATSDDMSAVPPFIDELDNLEKAVGVAALLQVGDDFVDLNRGQLSNIKITPFTTRNTEEETTRSPSIKLGLAAPSCISPRAAPTRPSIACT